MKKDLRNVQLWPWVGRTLNYAVLLLASLGFMIPLIWMVSTSLQTTEQIFRLPPTLFPNPFRWLNYPEALKYKDWGQYSFNTLIRYALPSVIGTVTSSSLVAYGLSCIRWRGREIAFSICIATMMIPYQVTMVPLFIIYRRVGWINTFLPLVVPSYLGAPYFIFLLRQFFLGIPIELFDAAHIDGCSELGIFVRILVPLAKPALAVVVLFQFLGVWNDYLGPLIYLSREDAKVIAQGLNDMWRSLMGVGAVANSYAYLMAIASLYSLPIITFFFLAQRTFIEGIAVTGIKM